jgi:hypothetical protein
MSTPADRAPQVASLWGGVRDDIQNGTDFTAAAASAQAQAETAEGGRRGKYESSMLPLGASYGDEIAIPEVPTAHSKHVGGDDAGYSS